MSTCLLCDAKIDAKSGIQICSTCAIIAMPDEDFQKLYFISLLENVHIKEIPDNERTRILTCILTRPDQKALWSIVKRKGNDETGLSQLRIVRNRVVAPVFK